MATKKQAAAAPTSRGPRSPITPALGSVGPLQSVAKSPRASSRSRDLLPRLVPAAQSLTVVGGLLADWFRRGVALSDGGEAIGDGLGSRRLEPPRSGLGRALGVSVRAA